MEKKYGEIIDVAVVDTVDVMVPNTLMAICIDYCFIFKIFNWNSICTIFHMVCY